MRFALIGSMAEGIGLVEVLDGPSGQAYISGSSAPELAGAPSRTLRFRLKGADRESLEALRHARRSLLREEWTRGRESDEPSLEEAVFSPAEIVWVVRPEQREWCLRKLEDLIARANRALRELASP